MTSRLPSSIQPTANDFANYLIALARHEGKRMTTYKLQKLLYYVQAWSLAERDRPAFGDSVRAWKDGPVVKSVYARFKKSYYVQNVDPPDDGLSPEDRAHCYAVWMMYRECDPDALVEMTHRERPWIEAREGYGSGEPSDVPISPRLMREECRDQMSATHRAMAVLAEELTRKPGA